MALSLFLFLVGLVLLIGSAEALVRGSASLARGMGISPLVIGLTVVAFGTSAPELITSVFAVLRNAPDIGVGTIVGSNISNILLILGIAAMIHPLTLTSNTVWKEIPFALLSIILLFILGNDYVFGNGTSTMLSRSDGFVFLSFLAIFIYYIFGIAKVNGKNTTEEAITTYRLPLSFFLAIAGTVGLFIGGNMLIENATKLAQYAHLSETFIGLTIVAIGTSLPELATVVVAARKRETDIAIGNIVGSNIFNIFWILGATSLVQPLIFNTTLNGDVVIAIGATFLLFLTMFIGNRHKLERWEGILFVLLYIAYIASVVIRG